MEYMDQVYYILAKSLDYFTLVSIINYSKSFYKGLVLKKIIYWVLLWIGNSLTQLLFVSQKLTLQNLWLITVTSLCTAYNFNLLSVFIFIGLTLIYYCLLLFGNQLFIWVTSVLLLGIWSWNESLLVRLFISYNIIYIHRRANKSR